MNATSAKTFSANGDSSSPSDSEFSPKITRDSTRSGASRKTPNELVAEFIQWLNYNPAVCFGQVFTTEDLDPHTETQPAVVREPLVGYKDARLQRKGEDASTIESLGPELQSEAVTRNDPVFQGSIITEAVYPLDSEGNLSADPAFFNILPPLQPDEVVDLNLLCISEKGYYIVVIINYCSKSRY